MSLNPRAPIPEKMKSIIKTCANGLGGVGIFGGLAGPGADLAIIIPTWVGMTMALADEANHTMSTQTAKRIALAVTTGLGAFMGGTKLASTGIAWLTAPFTGGASLAIAAAANAALNLTITRAYGRAVARYFIQVDEIDAIDVIITILISFVKSDLGFGD